VVRKGVNMQKDLLETENRVIRAAVTPIPFEQCRVNIGESVENNNRYSIDECTNNILVFALTICELNGLELAMNKVKNTKEWSVL
jgi:hypothetical protein